jgi:hypothetical protein
MGRSDRPHPPRSAPPFPRSFPGGNARCGIVRRMAPEKNLKTESEIQDEFRKKRHIYWLLMAALFGFLIVFRFAAPEELHVADLPDFLLFSIAIVIVLAAYIVFRCPSCRASLIQTHAMPWSRKSFCPRCGVKLAE